VKLKLTGGCGGVEGNLAHVQSRERSGSLGVEAWLDERSEDELDARVSALWTEVDGLPVSGYSEDEAERAIFRRSVRVQELGYGRLVKAGRSWSGQ